VAQRLEELGFDDVTVLVGGYDRWVEAELPTERKVNVEEASAPPT
jgi:3-mercaptopyruvate sulfurtransferase SseA